MYVKHSVKNSRSLPPLKWNFILWYMLFLDTHIGTSRNYFRELLVVMKYEYRYHFIGSIDNRQNLPTNLRIRLFAIYIPHKLGYLAYMPYNYLKFEWKSLIFIRINFIRPYNLKHYLGLSVSSFGELWSFDKIQKCRTFRGIGIYSMKVKNDFKLSFSTLVPTLSYPYLGGHHVSSSKVIGTRPTIISHSSACRTDSKEFYVLFASAALLPIWEMPRFAACETVASSMSEDQVPGKIGIFGKRCSRRS